MLCSSRSAAPWLRSAAAIAGLLAMTGCAQFSNTMSGGVTSLITPYRVEIVQGNVVTREQADLIKPGMSRTQVRDVLGSPMLADPFHAERWDYVFTMRRQGTEPQQRTVVVEFDGDRVKTLTAPELPTEREFVASISRPSRSDKEPKLALTDEEKAALPAPAPRVASNADQPKGAARTYPPLEPL
ncbi:outer membrane protein assembly factor BamE [Ideonella sp.]|jgi:outer membrane protein assembly factor BamE|uniref:outer membrane protein assembly factor BamE n=1 Tax=Ideonella sp. TaxID=1929293 RepID=UPI0037BF15D8